MFTKEFDDAFAHAMLYEVGGHFDPSDAETIAGLIDTPTQRKKVGYVNIKADRGGETKYGVAKKANPSVDITRLNLDGAKEIYYNLYWLAAKCDKLPAPLSILQFDGAVNHGVGRQAKFLHRALGITPENTVVGNIVLSKITPNNQKAISDKLIEIRRNFYLAIVKNDPTQAMFLKGWMRRIDETAVFINKYFQ